MNPALRRTRGGLAISAVLFGLSLPMPMPVRAQTQAQEQPKREQAPEPASTEPDEPVDVRLDWNNPLRIESPDQDKEKWPVVLPNIVSLLSAIVALIAVIWSHRGVKSTLAQSSNRAELQDIQKKLDQFYGPYIHLSETNRLLIDEFRSRQSSTFRTLIMLLNPNWRSSYSTSDQTIVEEIIRLDVALRRLIQSKSGLVDRALVPYLARASAHFRMMKLAFDGKLENAPHRFARYVYPRELDAVLDLEMRRLSERMIELRHATRSIAAIQPLSIPFDKQLLPWDTKELGAKELGVKDQGAKDQESKDQESKVKG